jgi:hypothetical protein
MDENPYKSPLYSPIRRRSTPQFVGEITAIDIASFALLAAGILYSEGAFAWAVWVMFGMRFANRLYRKRPARRPQGWIISTVLALSGGALAFWGVLVLLTTSSHYPVFHNQFYGAGLGFCALGGYLIFRSTRGK